VTIRVASLVLLILIVGRLVYWLEPYGVSVDESIYLAVAEAWNHYGTLYVDAVDRKPPLFYGIYLAMGNLFGFFNIHAAHIVFLLMTFMLCWGAEILVRRLENPPPAGFAAILCALYSSAYSREFVSANTEIAMLLPLVGTYYFLFKMLETRQHWFLWTFAASLLAATATLLKQVAFLPFAFSMFALWAWFLYRSERRQVVQTALGVMAGVCVVYGLTYAAFTWAGTWHEMMHWAFWDNFGYMDHGSELGSSRPVFSAFFITLGIWPILWAGLYWKGRRLWLEPRELCLLGAVIGSLVFIWAGGRLFSHYFVPIFWFLVLASASSVAYFVTTRYKAIAWSLVVLPFVLLFFVIHFRDAIFPVFTGGSVHSFDLKVQEKITEVSDYIRDTTTPDDRIAVWGMSAQIYAMSKRGSATRFIPADYVSGRLAGMSTGYRLLSEENMALYLGDLKRNRPTLFIDTHPAGINDYQHFPLTDYPELISYLEANYEFEGLFGQIGVWRLKQYQADL